MQRKLTFEETQQLNYLNERKKILTDNFIGSILEINAQIKEINNGSWLKSIKNKK